MPNMVKAQRPETVSNCVERPFSPARTPLSSAERRSNVRSALVYRFRAPKQAKQLTLPGFSRILRTEGQRIDGQGGTLARRRFQNGRLFLRGKDPMWVGRWREDVVQADGSVRRIEKSTVIGTRKQFPTKRLAQRRLDLLLAQINSPDYRPGKVATLAEFAEIWKVQVLNHRKPSTIHASTSHLQHHIVPGLGSLRLSEIGREAQQAFITCVAPKVARKTLLNIWGTLSSMLRTAKKWGYITEGVDSDTLEFPAREVRPAVRFFTADEVRKIIGSAEQPWRTMYAICAMTGLRSGELFGLSVDDLDFERKQIHVRRSVWRGKIQTPKSARSEAVLPMPEALADMLKLYLQQWRPNPLRLLFANQRGNPFFGENVIRDRLAPLLRELGLPRAGFHAFRHAHASLLLEAGATPAVAQAQMRHSDPRITLGIYAHVLGDAQRLAAERVAEVLRSKLKARRGRILRPIAPKSVKQKEWIQ
jgi:integrase